MIEFILVNVLRIVEFAIIVEALLSWLPNGVPRNAFTAALEEITRPFLAVGRKIQARILPGLPIDFSPIVGFIMIDILRVIISIIL